eukprot:3496462-Prymnesium_polylepis.2
MWTPMWTPSRPHAHVHPLAQEGDVPQATWLLSQGTKPDAPSLEGATPLQAACQNGHAPLARLLLDHGAEPNPTGVGPSAGYAAGFPPLHLAAALRPQPPSAAVELVIALLAAA